MQNMMTMMHLDAANFTKLVEDSRVLAVIGWRGKKSLAISFFASEATKGRAREIRLNYNNAQPKFV